MNTISPQELANTIPVTPWIDLSEELALYSLVGLVGPEVCISFSDRIEAGRRLPIGQRPWVLEADNVSDDERDTEGDAFYQTRFSSIWTQLILWSAAIRRLMAEHDATGICIFEQVKFTRASGRLRMSFSFYLPTKSGAHVGKEVG